MLPSSAYQSSTSRLDKAMSPEQFNQIVEAILDGKYSWACVLILRFAGYNPLHYIPYRTYNRLMKENRQAEHQPPNQSRDNQKAAIASATRRTSKITDLTHLEALRDKRTKVRGGALIGFSLWRNRMLGS